MSPHRIFKISFSKVYPAYVAKAENKGRTSAEVDQIILWLTGYSPGQLEVLKKDETNLETFFSQAPQINPKRTEIKGSVCGVKVEAIEDSVMREIRYLDKLVDELAKGKPMLKILRA